jgi:hypothetical protein
MDAPAIDDAARHAPLRLPAELTIYTAAELRDAWLAWLAGARPRRPPPSPCAGGRQRCDEIDAAGAAAAGGAGPQRGPPAAPAAAAATQRAGARRLPRPGPGGWLLGDGAAGAETIATPEQPA